MLAPKPAAAVEFIIKGTEVTAACLERRCANGEAGRDASEVAPIGVDDDEVGGVMFSSRGMVIIARWAACNCQSSRCHAVGWHEQSEVARQQV